MDKVLDYVKVAAIAFFVVGILGWGFKQYRSGKLYADQASSNTNQLMTEMTEDSIVGQDGLTIMGQEVISLVKDNCSYATVKIVTGAGGAGSTTTFATADYKDSANASNVIAVTDKTKPTYVNPRKMFLCVVTVNEVGVVEDVVFTQQN